MQDTSLRSADKTTDDNNIYLFPTDDDRRPSLEKPLLKLPEGWDKNTFQTIIFFLTRCPHPNRSNECLLPISYRRLHSWDEASKARKETILDTWKEIDFNTRNKMLELAQRFEAIKSDIVASNNSNNNDYDISSGLSDVSSCCV